MFGIHLALHACQDAILKWVNTRLELSEFSFSKNLFSQENDVLKSVGNALSCYESSN